MENPEFYQGIKRVAEQNGMEYIEAFRISADQMSTDFDRVFVEQPYWFNNEDRPVYQVIFTNDDVPAIIADRQKILDQMNKVRYTMSTIQRPILQADGRSTRRTQPEAWAAFDKAVEDYNAQRDALQKCLNLLLETLGKLEYYSTTLLQLR